MPPVFALSTRHTAHPAAPRSADIAQWPTYDRVQRASTHFALAPDRESSQHAAAGGEPIVRAIEAIALAKNPHEKINHRANYRDDRNGVSRTSRGFKN